jgi:uncharacterized protein YjbI with pentapeptide repeats
MDEVRILRGAVLARSAAMNGIGMAGAVLVNRSSETLNMSDTEVQGRANLNSMQSQGTISAHGARFGELNLRDAVIQAEWGTAIEMSGMKVKGTAFMESLVAQGCVHSADSDFGELILSCAKLNSYGTGRALNLPRTVIRGSLLLDRSELSGSLHLFAAKVGYLDFSSAKFSVGIGTAIEISCAEIVGTAVFRRIQVCGGISAADAAFAQLIMEGAVLDGGRSVALNLSRTAVAGRASLIGLCATGSIRAVGLRVGGPLDLAGAYVRATKSGHSFDISRATVDGRLRLEHCRFEGMVIAGGAELFYVTLRNARFEGQPDGMSLDFSSAAIVTLCLSTGLTTVGGFNFTGTEVQNLFTPAEGSTTDCLPLIGRAVGWKLGMVHGSLRTERKVAYEWLRKIPADYGSSASIQPWKELARVYDGIGQPDDGRWLRRQAAAHLTRTSGGWSKARRIAYSWLVGYGYYPLLVLLWLAVLWGLVYVLASTQAANFSPSDTRAATKVVIVDGVEKHLRVDGTHPAPDNYPAFSPELFAIDTALPPVPTGQSQAWRVTENTWLPLLFAAIKSAGWALSALLIAGVTGFLRKD